MRVTGVLRAVPLAVSALLAVGIASSNVEAKTKIVWYNVPGNHNSYQLTIESMMDEFKKQFPDVDLDIQYSNASFDKMLIALAGGAPPDILTVSHRGSVGAILDGLFAPVDLSVFGASSLADLEKQFIPGTLRTMIYNGQLYYMPSEVSVIALFYNKTMLETLGYSKPPATWEDMVAIGRKIRNRDVSGQYTRVIMGNPDTWIGSDFLWPTVMRQNGVDWVDIQGRANFLHPKAVEALTTYNTLFTAGIVPNVNAYSYFNEGKALAKIGGSYEVFDLTQKKLPFELAAAPLPQLQDGKRVSLAYAFGNFVLSTAKNQKLAWEVIKFFSGPERAAAWFERALFIPWQGKWLNDVVARYPIYIPFIAEFNYAQAQILHPNWSDISKAIKEAQQSIIDGKQSVGQALAEANSKIQIALDKATAARK